MNYAKKSFPIFNLQYWSILGGRVVGKSGIQNRTPSFNIFKNDNKANTKNIQPVLPQVPPTLKFTKMLSISTRGGGDPKDPQDFQILCLNQGPFYIS